MLFCFASPQVAFYVNTFT